MAECVGLIEHDEPLSPVKLGQVVGQEGQEGSHPPKTLRHILAEMAAEARWAEAQEGGA